MNNLRFTIILLIMFIFPYSAYCSPASQKLNKVLKDFSKVMRNQGFDACGAGGGVDDGKVRVVSIRLINADVMNLESARRLVVDIAEEFVHFANNNPKFNDFFLESPVTSRTLDLGIFGQHPCDLTMDYIGTAGLISDQIFYTKRNPDPHVLPSITVHEETFQEAVAIVKASQDSCSCQDVISLKTSDSSTEQNCSDTSELPEPALAIP